jgi:holo-[acyl-carrier protein] synthase
MIVGIGVDMVNVPRFTATLRRMSGLQGLYFAPDEMLTGDGEPRSAASLAARFAAKEAVSKALGMPAGTRHTECRVLQGDGGEPELAVSGGVASAAERIGVTRWHVSLSQEGDVAIALVIAERDERRGTVGR